MKSCGFKEWPQALHYEMIITFAFKIFVHACLCGLNLWPFFGCSTFVLTDSSIIIAYYKFETIKWYVMEQIGNSLLWEADDYIPIPGYHYVQCVNVCFLYRRLEVLLYNMTCSWCLYNRSSLASTYHASIKSRMFSDCRCKRLKG